MLTSAQVEKYRDRGYLSVEGFLSPSELKELQDVTDDFVEQSRKFTEHTDIFDLEPDPTPGGSQEHRRNGFLPHDMPFDDDRIPAARKRQRDFDSNSGQRFCVGLNEESGR